MTRVLCVACSLLAVLAAAAPADAFVGRVVSRQRVVVRQQMVRQNVVQRQVVQQVVTPAYVAPVVAAPLVVAPAYAAPVLQQQVQGCSQSVTTGCATMFVK